MAVPLILHNSRPRRLTRPSSSSLHSISVTSFGMGQDAIWLHDRRGDRSLSSEGTVINRMGAASLPSFSPNGRYVHYLRESTGSVRELWRADIESGRNEPVLPGIAIVSYVSIVFDQRSESGKPLTRNKL